MFNKSKLSRIIQFLNVGSQYLWNIPWKSPKTLKENQKRTRLCLITKIYPFKKKYNYLLLQWRQQSLWVLEHHKLLKNLSFFEGPITFNFKLHSELGSIWIRTAPTLVPASVTCAASTGPTLLVSTLMARPDFLQYPAYHRPVLSTPLA